MSPYWIHSAPDTITDDGQRPCARGEHCLEGEYVIHADGTRRNEPALGYRPMCDSDRKFVLRCIEALPAYYGELGDRIGDKGTAYGPKVSGSRAAPIPINLSVDELRVELVNVVASWAGRIYTVANLTGIETERSLHDRTRYGAPLTANTTGPFQQMCETLGAHLDALLVLAPEPMNRIVPLADTDALGDDIPVDRNYWGGYARALPELSGAHAGLEFIRLNARCRWLLGYTGKDEKITGRCFACEQLDVLVRPDSAVGLADFAECSACGTKYFGAEYTNLLRAVYEAELAKQKKAS